MADYTFITQWQFKAPISQVWDELYHSSRWPSWWRAVKSVETIKPGGEEGVGGIKQFTWRGALPYALSFDMMATRVEPPHVLEGEASGELDGRGIWTLSEKEGLTLVQYDWIVRTTKPWMVWLSPIARPVFRWNHDVVMRWGEEGLRRHLKAKQTVAG